MKCCLLGLNKEITRISTLIEMNFFCKLYWGKKITLNDSLEYIKKSSTHLQQQSRSTGKQSTSSWQGLYSSTSERGNTWSGRSLLGWLFSWLFSWPFGWSRSSGVLWSFSSWQWTPSGVLSDNVIYGNGGSGYQSWGNCFRTYMVFTRSDGDQSGRFISDCSSGNVIGGRGNCGDGSDRSDSRELHYYYCYCKAKERRRLLFLVY